LVADRFRVEAAFLAVAGALRVEAACFVGVDALRVEAACFVAVDALRLAVDFFRGAAALRVVAVRLPGLAVRLADFAAGFREAAEAAASSTGGGDCSTFSVARAAASAPCALASFACRFS